MAHRQSLTYVFCVIDPVGCSSNANVTTCLARKEPIPHALESSVAMQRRIPKPSFARKLRNRNRLCVVLVGNKFIDKDIISQHLFECTRKIGQGILTVKNSEFMYCMKRPLSSHSHLVLSKKSTVRLDACSCWDFSVITRGPFIRNVLLLSLASSYEANPE